MIKVVLDTNIVVSALLNGEGLEAAVLDLALNNKLRLCFSETILTEYAGVLQRKRLGLDPERAAYALGHIREVGTFVKATRAVSVSRDEADNRFLECAQAGNADFLVTGNTRHFPKQWEGTQVVTARQLIELLALSVKR